MNYLTLSELTQKVITSLSMYQGTATQLYAEDRIVLMLERLFIKLFESRFWDNNTFWYKYTLSGENGVVNEDVSENIAQFTDIDCIHTENNPRFSLKRLNKSTNPYEIKGTTPVYYERSEIDKKIFAVVPYNATGTVYVRARTRPTKFLDRTIIPFDPDVLVLGVCWEYAVDDGNNQSEIQKFQQMYQERLKQLENLDNAGEFDWNDDIAHSSLMTDWR